MVDVALHLRDLRGLQALVLGEDEVHRVAVLVRDHLLRLGAHLKLLGDRRLAGRTELQLLDVRLRVGARVEVLAVQDLVDLGAGLIVHGHLELALHLDLVRRELGGLVA